MPRCTARGSTRSPESGNSRGSGDEPGAARLGDGFEPGRCAELAGRATQVGLHRLGLQGKPLRGLVVRAPQRHLGELVDLAGRQARITVGHAGQGLGQSVGHRAELLLQRSRGRRRQVTEFGVHAAHLLRAPARGLGLLLSRVQSQPAVHLVADPQLVAERLRRGDHALGGAPADRGRSPVSAVEHRAGLSVDEHRDREHGADALREHRTVVVVGDRERVPVVGHRHRPAGDHAGPAESGAGSHRESS